MRGWIKNIAHRSSGNAAFGEPDKWEFDYSWDMVRTGFWLWAMSDFQNLPSQDDVSRYDSRWISDMKLMMQLYSFQTNDTAVMKLFEEQNAVNELAKTRKGIGRKNAP